MADKWPCSVCPVRDAGFCGALLGLHSDEKRSGARTDWQDFQEARPGEVVLVRQESSDYVYVLCEGWASRFVQLPDGRRQTLRYILAGDLFSAVSFFVEKLNFSIQAVTQIRLSRFKRAAVHEQLAANTALSQTLAASCAAEDADAGELLLALGRRSAEERIAYLFLHLSKRIALRNVIREQRYPFPLLQQHIAEIAGLTPVHVSRVLRQFRERGICRLSGGTLEVLNLAELERMGSVR